MNTTKAGIATSIAAAGAAATQIPDQSFESLLMILAASGAGGLAPLAILTILKLARGAK